MAYADHVASNPGVEIPLPVIEVRVQIPAPGTQLRLPNWERDVWYTMAEHEPGAGSNPSDAIAPHEIFFSLPENWIATPSNSRLFGRYRKSEAEVLAAEAQHRHRTRGWLDSVRIRSQRIDITTPPNSSQSGYLIHDAEIARALNVQPGHTLTDGAVNRLPAPQRNLISEFVTDPSKIEWVREGINPVYALRPLENEQNEYLRRIRQLINDEITTLNQAAPQNYFWDNTFDGTIQIHHREEDWNVFHNLMNSIAFNQEENFIRNLLILATRFDSAHSNAKNGFIETFTYLFVAKEFPSEGVRQNYLHFALRCGGIY
jgi:hypothetical protein